jgi:hypothetical protein
MVVQLITLTNGFMKTTLLMRLVPFTKVVVGLTVLDAALCLSAETAKLAKPASCQMSITSIRLQSMEA